MSELPIPQGTRLVTVDVFDTLFLRGRESEDERFAMLARRLGGADWGRGVRASDWEASRRLAHVSAYRMVLAGRSASEEARHEAILGMQLRLLGLPDSLLARLVSEEVEMESGLLTLNIPLARALSDARSAGVAVALASDMYLSAESILRIGSKIGLPRLLHLDPGMAFVSSDHGATKRSGRLFGVILERAAQEIGGLRPDQCLHVGDDVEGDVRAPARLGWASAHRPRPGRVLAARRLRAAYRRWTGAGSAW